MKYRNMESEENKVLIGTSGYSYDDWRSVFYPAGIEKGKMLDYYAREFSAVEVNSTYYRIPHPAVFYQMAKKTPAHFKFIVKVNRETTHNRQKNSEAVGRLLEAIQPLREAGKFSGLLAQFPYSFKNTPENRHYLVQTREYAKDLPLYVEFRNWTWDRPASFELLRQYGIGYVNVDQPRLRGLLKPQAVVIGQHAYIRFHGRNSQEWWNGTNQSRYDYLYSKSELDDWMIHISHILKKSHKSFIFFNNHPRGKAIQNARMLREMIEKQLPFLNY